MSSNLSPWVEKAAALPVAFAQVREDPLVDLRIVERLAPDARVALIASGGCTAALLAGAPNVAVLHLVDPNPAQLALARLKLRLLATADQTERTAVLGHAPLVASDRLARLTSHWSTLGLAPDVLGPREFVAELGPDHAGRYERLFAALRDSLEDQSDDLAALLRLADPVEQQRRADPTTTLGRRLDEALDTVMALPNLVRLYGAEATNNPVEPFSRHFAGRIRHVLATLPAHDNPYLRQMLGGSYPVDSPAPWLAAPVSERLPEITWSNAFMADALCDRPAQFDFVHLSNILDWLTPDAASATLEVACRALRPGGWTLIRQLNSTLDIPRLGPMFVWHTSEAEALHARDRSFFYRALHLGRKR